MTEDTEEMKEFIEKMNECGTRISEGRIAVDLPALCRLVGGNRETSARVINLFCIMGKSNPAYFQGALSLASAYQIEFNDPTFVKIVHSHTRAAGVEEWLERIGILE